jgi:hypothetical protein
MFIGSKVFQFVQMTWYGEHAYQRKDFQRIGHRLIQRHAIFWESSCALDRAVGKVCQESDRWTGHRSLYPFVAYSLAATHSVSEVHKHALARPIYRSHDTNLMCSFIVIGLVYTKRINPETDVFELVTKVSQCGFEIDRSVIDLFVQEDRPCSFVRAPDVGEGVVRADIAQTIMNQFTPDLV